MKKILIINILLFLLIGCFNPPDITPPQFIPKSPPDSVKETGIDAHHENAIYLEWEEPATAELEGILSYYVYRGKFEDGEYKFKYLDEVERNASLIYDSDKYIDYDVNLDSTYYYYLKSYNDFTVSSITSDTVFYKLAHKVILQEPQGDISESSPRFYFAYSRTINNRINYFYFRLYQLDGQQYKIKYFVKTHHFDLSQSKFYVYLNNTNPHATVLIDSIAVNESGNKYLENGTYRWRIDAVSGELGGAPETEGSESDWMYFTVK
ncbi:MAG: hypothetical protein U9O95_02210 [Candidatus Marinimicrobia bacterium]|nr:hypothetical protein [Candidatus Neomarinimicrobiota bacterium]